jgi:hypothetical protein
MLIGGFSGIAAQYSRYESGRIANNLLFKEAIVKK